jgi:hypothetical protein
VSLENVETGTYPARVDRVEFFKSRGGTPGLKVFFVLPDVGADGICDIWLSPKAIAMARQQLRKLGYNPDTGSLSELANHPDHLRGAEFDVEVYEDEYQGKFYKKAQIPIPRNDGLKSKEIDDLDKALKEGASKREGQAPPPASRPAPAAQPPRREPDKGIDYDDIPF